MYATPWSNLSKNGSVPINSSFTQRSQSCVGNHTTQTGFCGMVLSAGVNMWKAGLSVKERYEMIVKPFPENIYVVNEAYSKHQCWVEGTLSMCYDVLTS